MGSYEYSHGGDDTFECSSRLVFDYDIYKWTKVRCLDLLGNPSDWSSSVLVSRDTKPPTLDLSLSLKNNNLTGSITIKDSGCGFSGAQVQAGKLVGFKLGYVGPNRSSSVRRRRSFISYI